ncbi:MAG: methyltransferase domain-containing protein [Rhodospirillales bacterium]
MRPELFDQFRPVCPGSLMREGIEAPLWLASDLQTSDGHLDQGVLHGGDGDTVQEYPVLNGAPLLIGDIRSYLSDHQSHLLLRDDLSPEIESIIGDGIGSGSLFDMTRQHLSTYAWDHYAGLDPSEITEKPRPGAALRCLEAGLTMVGTLPGGPILDVGCSVGRTTFRLAEKYKRPALGLDLNFSMIRMAQSILRRNIVDYPRRRIGLVYDRRQFDVSLGGTDLVDFWVADATVLPFRAASFALTVALNSTDSVASPADLVQGLARITKPDGWLVLATPYDWSPAVTRTESWIGGHSQRAEDRGAAEPRLRALLSESGWTITDELPRQPWATRLHDRSSVDYAVHLIVARRQG